MLIVQAWVTCLPYSDSLIKDEVCSVEEGDTDAGPAQTADPALESYSISVSSSPEAVFFLPVLRIRWIIWAFSSKLSLF